MIPQYQEAGEII
jgi:serine/threonine protein kinase